MNCIPKPAYMLIFYHCGALPTWGSCPCQQSCPMKVDGWICLELLSVQSWYHPLNSSLHIHANNLIQYFQVLTFLYLYVFFFQNVEMILAGVEAQPCHHHFQHWQLLQYPHPHQCHHRQNVPANVTQAGLSIGKTEKFVLIQSTVQIWNKPVCDKI